MASKWKVTKVSDLLSIKHGFAFKGEYFTDEETEYQLTTPGNFSISGGFQDIKPKYYDGPIPSDYVLSPGQIIVTMTDLSKKSDTLGFAAVIPNDEKTWLHNQRVGLVQIHDLEACNAVFINYLFRTHEYRSWVIGSATGTTVKHTSPSRITSYEFLLPPLAEQQAIAHILGTLDDKIELNRQMNETLEAMAQALFKSWFVDFDPVIDNALLAGKAIPEPLKQRAELRQTQLDSGKAKANSEINDLFPSEFEFTEELGWIPKGWSVLKFREITEAKQGKYLPSKEMQDQQDENYHFPVWGGNGIRGYSEEYIYEEPVVVMTCRGSNCGLLKITDGKSWITNTSFACKPKVGSTFFLYQYFSHDDFSSCISGSAQPQITYTALENKIMPFPISEKTVQRASEWLQILRNRQLSTLKQNETLAKLRDTLLPKLISGELRIADAEKFAENI